VRRKQKIDLVKQSNNVNKALALNSSRRSQTDVSMSDLCVLHDFFQLLDHCQVTPVAAVEFYF
jgi:hypothetical protein